MQRVPKAFLENFLAYRLKSAEHQVELYSLDEENGLYFCILLYIILKFHNMAGRQELV